MTEKDRYQITADCAYVTVQTLTGTAVALGYRGAFVSPDDPKLQHLLDSGMVAKVDDGASIGVNAEGTTGPAETPAAGPTSVVSAVPYTDEQLKANADKAAADAKREAAKAKLPADGSAPHQNASEDVWVAYAVSKGLDEAESKKAGKAEIIKALSSGKA
jgi:hypothetical protein